MLLYRKQTVQYSKNQRHNPLPNYVYLILVHHTLWFRFFFIILFLVKIKLNRVVAMAKMVFTFSFMNWMLAVLFGLSNKISEHFIVLHGLWCVTSTISTWHTDTVIFHCHLLFIVDYNQLHSNYCIRRPFCGNTEIKICFKCIHPASDVIDVVPCGKSKMLHTGPM